MWCTALGKCTRTEQTIVPTKWFRNSCGAIAILAFVANPNELMAYERHLVGVEKLLLHRRHVYVPTFRIPGFVTEEVGDR